MLNTDQFIILKKKLVGEFKIELKIKGTSMLPLIKEGDVVIVQSLEKFQPLKRFDILVYFAEDKLICHYFWQQNQYFETRQNKTLITRPLNPLRRSDFPISDDRILGVVVNYKINLYLKIKIVSFAILKKLK